MNIVLIVSDTFRYDHVAFHQGKATKTPELDAFAQSAVVFDQCHVSSFPTIPHRTDMITGRYGFPFYGWQPLADQTILSEYLWGHGYVNQLIADCPHLMRTGYNFSRGFHGYHWVRGQESDIAFTMCNYPIVQRQAREKTRIHPLVFGEPMVNTSAWANREWRWEEDTFAAQTARLASKWLEQNYRAERFFLWIDFFDVHEPWEAPDYLVQLYDPGYTCESMYHPNYGHASVYTKDELRNMRAQYAAEVTLVSKWIGHVLRKIEDLGLFENSIVIFTSDHGMYLGEHDRTGKSNISDEDERGEWPLYEEITHIPLMVRAPGLAPRRVRDLVQPVDIMPTILDLAGLPAPDTMHGVSLKPLAAGAPGARGRDVAYASSALLADRARAPRTTIRDDCFTLIVGGAEGVQPELYDLSTDPAQQTNLWPRQRAEAERLHARFVTDMRAMETDEAKLPAL